MNKKLIFFIITIIFTQNAAFADVYLERLKANSILEPGKTYYLNADRCLQMMPMTYSGESAIKFDTPIGVPLLISGTTYWYYEFIRYKYNWRGDPIYVIADLYWYQGRIITCEEDDQDDDIITIIDSFNNGTPNNCDLP